MYVLTSRGCCGLCDRASPRVVRSWGRTMRCRACVTRWSRSRRWSYRCRGGRRSRRRCRCGWCIAHAGN